MVRLNQRAFELLKAEIEKCAAHDIAGQVQKEIALKRLTKLCNQAGQPLGADELHEIIDDLFPNFNPKVLKAAAWANCPPAVFNKLKLAGGLLVGSAGVAGLVWVLNLPYPMIRWPVARVAPIILLPSFISMDSNYRQAIAFTEQADQLVNQATSAADLELGETKVKAAQKSLDALPVWFLGYYPQSYCHFFHCTWRFTLDEFQGARKEVGRMEAKLFQEKNAQEQLNQADQVVANAKQQYQEAPNEAEKTAAITQWQQAIDSLNQIPAQTLAGKMVQTKRPGYERDFQQVSGLATGVAQTSSLIDAAKEFAKTAQQSAAGSTHTADEWEEVERQWQEAISYLRQVDPKDPGFVASRKLLAGYERSLGAVRIRLKSEQASVQAYETAQQLTQNLFTSFPTNAASANKNFLIGQMQGIINQLDKVDKGTTVYPKAQEMLKSAQKKLAQIRR